MVTKRHSPESLGSNKKANTSSDPDTSSESEASEEASNQIVITKYECFDQAKAKRMAQDRRINTEKRDLIKTLLHRSEDGRLEVTYRPEKNAVDGEGGLHAPLYALQNLPGHIRAALTWTKAWDIDFKNSQPTILLHLAERMEAEGKPVMCTALRRYVEHRDAVLRQVGGDRTKAKKKVLAIINGSDRVDAPEIVLDIGKEVTIIKEWLKKDWVAKYPAYKDATPEKVMSIMLRDIERRCLLSADKTLELHGRSMMTFIHDGGLVLKEDGEEEFPEELLRACEQAIKCHPKLGYSVKLAVKPLFCAPEFEYGDEEDDEDEDEEDEAEEEDDPLATDDYGCLIKPYSDWTGALKFLELYGPENLKRVGLDLFIFMKTRGMWTKELGDIKDAVTRAGIEFYKLIKDTVVPIQVSAMVDMTAKLITKLSTVAPRDDSFFIDRIDSGINKLLFVDGILDLPTGVFSADFDPEIVFFKQIPRKYNPVRNEDMIAYVDEKLFGDPFKDKDMGDVLRHFYMRGMIGDYFARRMMLCIGTTSACKSTTTNAFQAAFGGLIGGFCADNLGVKTGPYATQEPTKSLGWVDTIYQTRIAYSDELSPGLALNGKLMDKLQSGGDMMQIRTLYSRESNIVNQSMLVMYLNEPPEIKPLLEPTLARILLVLYYYSFVDNPQLPHEKKRDPEIKKQLKTPAFRDALVHLMADEAQSWFAWKKANPGVAEMPVPAAVEDYKRDMLNPTTTLDINSIFLEHFEVTRDPKDVVPISRLNEHFEYDYGRAVTATEKRSLFDGYDIAQSSQRLGSGCPTVRVRTGLKDRKAGGDMA